MHIQHAGVLNISVYICETGIDKNGNVRFEELTLRKKNKKRFFLCCE